MLCAKATNGLPQHSQRLEMGGDSLRMVSLLESRFVTTEEATRKCLSGVHLFYTNKDADAYNTANAKACNEYAVHCSAVDTICGHRSHEEYTQAKSTVATSQKQSQLELQHTW